MISFVRDNVRGSSRKVQSLKEIPWGTPTSSEGMMNTRSRRDHPTLVLRVECEVSEGGLKVESWYTGRTHQRLNLKKDVTRYDEKLRVRKGRSTM